MIDWGADIIFGGHPHVVEPVKRLKKVIKSLSFTLWGISSNQRIETMQDVEMPSGRNVEFCMDVTIRRNR